MRVHLFTLGRVNTSQQIPRAARGTFGQTKVRFGLDV